MWMNKDTEKYTYSRKIHNNHTLINPALPKCHIITADEVIIERDRTVLLVSSARDQIWRQFAHVRFRE